MSTTVVVVLSAALAAVWLVDGGDDETRPPATTTSVVTAAPATEPGGAPGSPSAPAVPAPAPGPSASNQLEPFFAAAAAMDDQLHEAAAAINAAGPPWATISEHVATSVRAADPGDVAATLSAGLPHDLLESLILVYSDLASRRSAMQSFAVVGVPYTDEATLLAELSNGHEAATRFDADLAAARSLAAAAPRVAVAPPDSRPAAEALLIVLYVDGLNGGCDSRGGGVVTELPPITWEDDGGGTIGEPPDAIGFAATRGANGTYEVEIRAC